MRIFKRLLFVLFSLFPLFIYGQNSQTVDSLFNQLNQEQSKALRLSILEELAYNHTHPDSILEYSYRLMKEACELQEYNSVVTAYAFIGDAQRLKGSYDLAFKSFFTGLKVADERELSRPGLMCRIADTYSVMGDAKNSNQYYKLCIAAMEDTETGLNYGTALFNLGDNYLKCELPDSAAIFNDRAAKVFESESFEIGLIYTQGNKGLIEAQRQKYELAVNELSTAILQLEAYEIYDAIADYQLGMAKVLLKNQELWLSLEYASQSLEVSHKGDYKEGIKNAAKLLSQVYETLNDDGEAFTFLKMYLTYKDSTQNTSILQRMEDFRRNYIVSKLKDTKEDKVTIAPSLTTEKPRYFAILFGVNDYQFNDDKITDLDQPIDNINALYHSLTTKYQFDASNTLLVPNPSRADIINTMEMLSEIITEKDNLLLFYAGHGIYDEKLSIGYWLPSDAKSYTKTNWLSNSVVRDYVAGLSAKHILLISDACFSGSIFKTRAMSTGLDLTAVSKLYKQNSRKAMTSGSLNTVPDKSVFMKYLIEGLDDNDAQFISARQLFNLIEPSVLNNTHNTPQYGIMHNTGDAGGEFIFITSQKKYKNLSTR